MNNLLGFLCAFSVCCVGIGSKELGNQEVHSSNRQNSDMWAGKLVVNMITTKKPQGDKKASITYDGSLTFTDVLIVPIHRASIKAETFAFLLDGFDFDYRIYR